MPTDLGNAPYCKKRKTVNAEKQSPKRQAVVNYGMFTTNLGVDQLELVEAKK
jgi:DNA mismatch repair protein MutS2